MQGENAKALELFQLFLYKIMKWVMLFYWIAPLPVNLRYA